MTLDYSSPGKVKVDMRKYIQKMMDEFPMEFKESDTATTPANDNLFDEDKSKKLDDKTKEVFHTFVAKGLFVSKQT